MLFLFKDDYTIFWHDKGFPSRVVGDALEGMHPDEAIKFLMFLKTHLQDTVCSVPKGVVELLAVYALFYNPEAYTVYVLHSGHVALQKTFNFILAVVNQERRYRVKQEGKAFTKLVTRAKYLNTQVAEIRKVSYIESFIGFSNKPRVSIDED